VLFAIFILSSLQSMTYGCPPSIFICQEADVELPDDEKLWNATSVEEWYQRTEAMGSTRPSTFHDMVGRLMYGKEPLDSSEKCWDLSPFGATISMHAVNVRVWHLMQATESFSSFAVDAQTQKTMKNLMAAQTETALGRCYNIITRARSDGDQTWCDTEGPLLFNCLAVLRTAYITAFAGISSFNRMVLLTEHLPDISEAIEAYVAIEQNREPLITKAIAQSLEGLLVPIRAGAVLVRKTAALSWSIEHAIAFWDCALFFTKWVYSMERIQQACISELLPDELENLHNVRSALSEFDTSLDTDMPLAAEVTRLWASFLDDTWVWGVTPRMAWILRQLAASYQKNWEANNAAVALGAMRS